VQQPAVLARLVVLQMAALLELAPVDRNLPEELPAEALLPPIRNYVGSPERLVWRAPQNWRARLPFLLKGYRECRALRLHFLRTVNRKYQ
jgi:hypothetical protein